MGLMSKIEKFLKIDGETRNKKLLEELGISTALYDHGKYKKILEAKGLEPVSVEEMAAGLKTSGQVERIEESFLNNGLSISIGSNEGVKVNEIPDIMNYADKLNENFKGYMEALSMAAGCKTIAHELVMHLVPDTFDRSTSVYSETTGGLNIFYDGQKARFKL